MPSAILPVLLWVLAAPPAPASTGQDAPQPAAQSTPDAPQVAPTAGDAPPSPEGDAGGEKDVTHYQFTGLDIEGELRTPALLHFLARIAGEFETLGIPHRSFLPELAATVTEDVL